MGELDIDREDDHLEKLQQISFEQAEHELKMKHQTRIKEEKVKTKTCYKQDLLMILQNRYVLILMNINHE